MHAFIVRPFGEKRGINFERVEKELIDPVLRKLGIRGRTTAEIAQAGNIREDMFQLLIAADLVIADISIHNANVFYELGIRHALCARYTFLIRCKEDEIPFDLRTDRYLEYSRDDPGGTAETLLKGIQETIDGARRDSPVFQLLPKLEPPDRERLLVVPAEFTEEVRRAEQNEHTGDLGLLGEEASHFHWSIAGQRVVGLAQFNHRAYEAARITWERVRGYNSDDPQANGRLATIYQKLGDLARSDEAINRVLPNASIPPREQAEFRALLGSNAKSRWIEDWQSVDAQQRRATALQSPWLNAAYDAYHDGFAADRDHFYPGLNALAMLTVTLEIARALPDLWTGLFESDEEAAVDLQRRERSREKLAATVDLVLETAQQRAEAANQTDRWLDISVADFACLTSSRPARVANLYRNALRGAQGFHLMVARRQLEIYLSLEVLVANARAALEVVDARMRESEADRSATQALERVIVFTGHRLDAPDRPVPRFPARAEARARAMIREAVLAEQSAADGKITGIAGGASGGDILFHEVCSELGIPTCLFLASPRDAFVTASVRDAGSNWVGRFDQLYNKLPHRTLGDSLQLPRWLRSLSDYTIWQRNNLWILHNALVHGASKVTLLALWNGEAEDGPGGTRHMVGESNARGAKTVVLDAKVLTQE